MAKNTKEVKEVKEVKAEVVKPLTVKQALNAKLPTVEPVTCFKDGRLNVHMTTIYTARESGQKALWKIAVAVHDIVASKCFEEDFKTQQALADYLGFSKQKMTQILNATAYAGKHTEAIAENYTLKRAEIYNKLEGKGKLDDFRKWVSDNDADISSDGKLEAAYKAYKTPAIESKSTDKAQAEGTAEGAENASEANTDEVKPEAVTDEAGAEYVRFEYNGLKYRIPVQALKNYMEK